MKKQEAKFEIATKVWKRNRNSERGCLVVIALIALIALALWLVVCLGGAPGGGAPGNDDAEYELAADGNDEREPIPEASKSLKQEVEILVIESRCEYDGESYDDPQELLDALPAPEDTIVNLKEFNASDVYDTLLRSLQEAGYATAEKNE